MKVFEFKTTTIFIKNEVEIFETVTLSNGNITMENNNDFLTEVICKKGIVKMKANNDVHGDVYAMKLMRGVNNEIKGEFIETEVK